MKTVIKMNKAEVNYLDNLAAKYRRRPFLDCNSTQQQDRLELFEIENSDRENGFLALLHTELEKNHKVRCGLDDSNFFVAYFTSCNEINRIMRSIFKKVRQSKKRTVSNEEFNNFNKALQTA